MKKNNSNYQPNVGMNGSALVISYSWLKNGGYVAALMLLAIGGSILWGMSGTFQCLLEGGNCFESTTDLVVVIAAIVLALVCLWRAICGFVNTTTVEVTREGVRFKIAGLPWFGGGFVSSEKITAIYISEHRATSSSGRGTPSYTVGLSKKFGSKTVYGEYTNDKTAAEHLARQIRKALGRD
mgnify:CR=1 FL=1